MNLIGKIFTVIVFLMSTVFMTIALMVYSAHNSGPNWKKIVDVRKATYDAETKKTEALSKERKSLDEQLKKEVDMAQARLAALETQYVALRKEHDANTKLVRDKEVEIGQLATSVGESHKNLEMLRGLAQHLRDDIKTSLAARDQNFQNALTKTDEFHNLIAELERLQKQNSILLAELQAMGSPTR
jgi:chromosome segregation ATPase